ncbi:hypothetical protein PPERSA_04946 [Pseudocohnilembus persalinus]|uniref:Uncharacterized protein n=1 Tax=Pseudocohnilembus persalinus TaxID=266149 RepID=A0A0V0QVT8_PSEPJ|nr:hypothetical protein PPERSA_04946 [Pseudocohnilembus persalinus]|eukprot:KRX06334.1 hypothetical protein PPERSA_04946 [Pseudocohnilembus persalinus]
MIPQFLRFIEDDTMRQIIWMSDILQGLFSALPMSLLQYLNNDQMSYWDLGGLSGIFLWLCFLSSAITVFIATQKLLATLFNDEIQLYYGLLTFLQEQPLVKIAESYEVPEKLNIDNIKFLLKFSQLKIYLNGKNQPMRTYYSNLAKFYQK